MVGFAGPVLLGVASADGTEPAVCRDQFATLGRSVERTPRVAGEAAVGRLGRRLSAVSPAEQGQAAVESEPVEHAQPPQFGGCRVFAHRMK